MYSLKTSTLIDCNIEYKKKFQTYFLNAVVKYNTVKTFKYCLFINTYFLQINENN